jgi:tetratricopeptide (TPR) repeat protein
MKISETELETDPAQALKELQAAQQFMDALPMADQNKMFLLQLRAALQHREAVALNELGDYSTALGIYAQVFKVDQAWAADPQDWRGQANLGDDLDDEATVYEYAADPALGATPGDRRRNLAAAEKLIAQELPIAEKGFKHDPSNEMWKGEMAIIQIRIGTIRSILHEPGDAEALASKGMAVLKEMAEQKQATSDLLNATAGELLTVEPASLRDPAAAVTYAERAVTLNHRRVPSMLLTLAQAYRASGQTEKSRATASEALALLPVPQPGSVKPRLRKLLEIQAQPVI